MQIPRKTAVLGTAALVAVPMALVAVPPATAAEREFRYAGAEIEFEVDKDDGRFEVDVQIDDADPGSRWRITLWHDGKRYHKRVHRADSDGEIDIDRNRPDTKGKDVFKIKVKRIGSSQSVTRTIILR